jgi:hypothetical protein
VSLQSYPISNEVLAAIEVAVFAVLETKRYQAYMKGSAPGEVSMPGEEGVVGCSRMCFVADTSNICSLLDAVAWFALSSTPGLITKRAAGKERRC